MEHSPIKTRSFILKPDQSYTFSSIFDLKFETDEILAELGYQYQIVPLDLPQLKLSELTPLLSELRTRMRSRLPLVPLTNETARLSAPQSYLWYWIMAVVDGWSKKEFFLPP